MHDIFNLILIILTNSVDNIMLPLFLHTCILCMIQLCPHKSFSYSQVRFIDLNHKRRFCDAFNDGLMATYSSKGSQFDKSLSMSMPFWFHNTICLLIMLVIGIVSCTATLSPSQLTTPSIWQSLFGFQRAAQQNWLCNKWISFPSPSSTSYTATIQTKFPMSPFASSSFLP